MQVVQMKIGDINPAKYNPRTITDEELSGLRESLKKFGFVEPLVLNTRTNTLVGGHQRLKAAELEGHIEVPVSLVDLSLAEEKALNVALNSPTISGKFDEEVLKHLLEEIRIEIPDVFEALNFGDFEIAEIPVEVLPPAGSDDGGTGELPAVPKSRKGDVWILGNHRIICGDATNFSDIEKLMDGAKADLYLTDPPYNVAYKGKTAESLTIQNDEMGDENFKQFLVDSFSNAAMVMNAGAGFYIWHADTEGVNFRVAVEEAGLSLRQCLVWVKNTLVMGRQDYHWKHEPCLYGWKEGASHNWYSDRKQTTVLLFDKPSRNGEHPTMKPIELFEYQMGNSTKPGDLVLDTFLGSGTSLIAAEMTGRTCYGSELDERYVDVIIKRWQKLTEREAILETTGESYDSISRH